MVAFGAMLTMTLAAALALACSAKIPNLAPDTLPASSTVTLLLAIAAMPMSPDPDAVIAAALNTATLAALEEDALLMAKPE
jgi:hypothetical protein